MGKKTTAAQAAEQNTSVAADAEPKEEVKEAVKKVEGANEVATAISYNYPDIVREALLKLNRQGMMDIIPFMREIGFFEAPASGANHSHKQGGLCEHSVNVMWCAQKLAEALYGSENITPELKTSLVIASLFHDLGKCGDYGKQMYIANILKSGKASEAKPFKRNPDLLPIDHATRSIKLATLFVDLTEEEEFAIRYHDGLYETANYAVKGHETELYMILHWADMWASKVIEGDDGEGDE